MGKRHVRSDLKDTIENESSYKLREEENLESYVKCLICGAKLRQIHSNHLAKHNMTIEDYMERFPNAQLISRDYHEELSRRYKRSLGRKREKVCVDCSKIFVTYSPNKIRCDACQRMYKLETKKRRERLRRRNYRGLDQILGSGDKSTCLTILPNGRILGVVWLENEMKKLNGSKRRNVNMKGRENYRCPLCYGIDFLLIVNHQPYCMECGGKIVYARENKNYSISEFVCSSCGLVIES